jgi:GNAT superfamily N-acetyltransferase
MDQQQPEIEFADRVVTLPEFRRLASSVDWDDHYDWNTMDAALTGSLRGAVAMAGPTVVGSARLVGDGLRYCYVQDVLVDPDFSDHGIASTLVERLLAWIAGQGSAEVFVGLFSSPEAEGVYESLGFARPEDMTGMQRWVRADVGLGDNGSLR